MKIRCERATWLTLNVNKLLFMSVVAALLVVSPVPRTAQAQQPPAASSATQAPADWDRYTVKDREFSVLLPAVPAMSSYRKPKYPFTGSDLRHIIGSYSQGVVYVVYLFERKQSLGDFISEFGRLSPFKRFLGSKFKREVEIGGVRGKEYIFQNDARKGATYFFSTSGYIYVFQALGSTLGNPDIGIPRFFESIQFGKTAKGLAIHDGPGEKANLDPSRVGGSSDTSPLKAEDVSVKALVVTTPEPIYTDAARMNEIKGRVVLQGVFSSSGTFTDIRVLSGLPKGLTESAINTARQIKFIPAIKDGCFVSMYIEMEYTFNLY